MKNLLRLAVIIVVGFTHVPCPAEIVFSEDFEGSFPGSKWDVGDTDLEDGQDYWGRESCGNPPQGSWQGWCAGTGDRTPCDEYDNNMWAYMKNRDPIDVSGADSVLLEHQVRYDMEVFLFEGKDSGLVRYRLDGGPWVSLDIYTWSNPRWPGYDRFHYWIHPGSATQLDIMYLVKTNGSRRDKGMYLDEIIVYQVSLPVKDELDRSDIPEDYVLLPNYPNPFNAVTEIIYALSENSTVYLSIYNLAGEKIATLVDGKQTAGYKSVTWDASDYSSGIYFYKLTAGDFTQTRRMTLLK